MGYKVDKEEEEKFDSVGVTVDWLNACVNA
jgi:hypothetical protein